MNQTERYYRIDQLIRESGCISFKALMQRLEISRATLKRDLQHLRDRLNAPIVHDRDAGGYRYDKGSAGPRFQLPGLWFSADEALALMTMHQILEGLDAGGLLGPHIRPLMERLGKALGSDEAPAREVLRRVRLQPAQQRRIELRWFQLAGKALMTRRRLKLRYFARHRAERSEREVSPLRLVHYRGNWYLDAWCHQSDGVRMFSIDAIEHAELLDTRARDVAVRQIDEQTAGGYGIYRGSELKWAELAFSAEAARWVRHEQWHPRQRGEDLPDGRYCLTLPYAAPQELEMDILRHGENVEVLAPAELRRHIGERLARAAAKYPRHAA